MKTALAALAAVGMSLIAGCGDDGGGGGDEEVDIGTSGGVFGADTEGGQCVPLTEALDSDYAVDADDAWPACVSDSGEYQRFNTSVSSISRSIAYDDIGKKLFTPGADPSEDDFVAARMIYEEDEGLGSRVARRYDPHFDVPAGTDCTVEDDVMAHPEYCVGPGRILPIVLDAFDKGVKGEEPRVQAGRIDGALGWFFVASTYKESFSCSETLEDCDSSYAYYDGAGMGVGLGGRIKAVDPDAYEAAQLGALAVRCWRDVDDAVPPEDTELREHARTQFDRAVIRGAISVLHVRIAAAQASSGDEQRFHWAFVSTFLHVLDSQAWRDADAADIIADATQAASPDDVDLDALMDALDALATCGG